MNLYMYQRETGGQLKLQSAPEDKTSRDRKTKTTLCACVRLTVLKLILLVLKVQWNMKTSTYRPAHMIFLCPVMSGLVAGLGWVACIANP